MSTTFATEPNGRPLCPWVTTVPATPYNVWHGARFNLAAARFDRKADALGLTDEEIGGGYATREQALWDAAVEHLLTIELERPTLREAIAATRLWDEKHAAGLCPAEAVAWALNLPQGMTDRLLRDAPSM